MGMLSTSQIQPPDEIGCSATTSGNSWHLTALEFSSCLKTHAIKPCSVLISTICAPGPIFTWYVNILRPK